MLHGLFCSASNFSLVIDPMQLVELDRKTQRNVLLTFFGFFAGPLALTVMLAALNSKLGSLQIHPRDSLWFPALVLVAAHALALNQCMRRLGFASAAHRKGRSIVVAISTLMAWPMYGMLIAPGLNGLGTSTSMVHTYQVSRVDDNAVTRSKRRHYYAVVNYPADAAGRYFLGSYAQAWSAGDGGLEPTAIRYVDVVHADGLLGARVILRVIPSR